MQIADSTNFPNAVFLGTFEDGSDEWHEVRSDGIGGSEIGTIMGLNPWESAYALWAKRTGQIENNFTGNTATEVGKWLEGPIIDRFAQKHPELEVFSAGTYASKEMRFLHANPDALARHRETGEWFVIEAKTAKYPWESVPAHYISQVQHYMDVMGIARAYVVGLVGMEPYEELIEADTFQQAAQRDLAFAFWQNLQEYTRPAWDGSEQTYQAVRAMHPLIEDREVDLGQLGIDLLAAQKIADAAYTKLTEYKSQVLDAMGYAKSGYVQVDSGKTLKVASRQIRGGYPALIVNKKGI